MTTLSILTSFCANAMQIMTIAKQALQILQSGDAQGSIRFILGRYELPADAQRITAMQQLVRRNFLHLDTSRRPGYEQEIRQLMSTLPTDSRDHNLLQKLLEMPLIKQESIYAKRKIPFLEDPQANAILHTISPAVEFFYDFKLGEDIWAIKNKMSKERVIQRMKREDSLKRDFTKADVDMIVNKCKDIIKRLEIKRVHDYYCMLEALTVVSGRRPKELMHTLTWAPGPTPLQATVSGICKFIANAADVHIIPLLVPYEDFARCMQAVRAFRTVDGDSRSTTSSTTRTGMNRASKWLFGERSLTHTHHRNIYVEVAYADKENNGFFPGGVTKEFWVKAALAHEMKFTPSSHYQTMTIE